MFECLMGADPTDEERALARGEAVPSAPSLRSGASSAHFPLSQGKRTKYPQNTSFTSASTRFAVPMPNRSATLRRSASAMSTNFPFTDS